MTHENKLLESALFYAGAGLFVFPLKPGQKSPAFKGWKDQSTTDAETIKSWWAKNPAFNIGIDCGKSGLTVIDYDAANGKEGLTIRDTWRQSHIMPDTWTARTPRGGIHEYYKAPDGKTKTGLYPGVDVRGIGGLVAAPPSVFGETCYTWEKHPVLYPLADADSTVYTFLFPVLDEPGRRQDRQLYTVPETIPEGGRTSALIALAGSLIGKGLSPESAAAAIREENAARCDPPLTDEELKREVFPALSRPSWKINTAPYTRDLPIDTELVRKLSLLEVAESNRFKPNDAGSARLFIDACGDRVLYAADRKKWLYYDGRRWDIDGENAVKERLKQLSDAFAVYILQNVHDESKRAEMLKFAGKWQQLRQRETILKDAQSVRPVKSDAFDKKPHLFNCLNGTLDLNTLEFREHRAGDMLSRVAAVSYDPTATAPRWERFIDEVTDGDRETARYIQKACGYALTGDTWHECLFILYGATSRNGKTTLLKTVQTMMGDYAATANPETFTKKDKANDNAPREDIARLAGVRFVTVSEPPRGMELNAALVKDLTGNEIVKARRLYESSFEYVPRFKLFFNTNHRPRVDDMTVFESERVKMIPFNVHFSQDRRDPYLKNTLQTPESLSGILNWCIEGLQAIRAEGFKEPPAVAQAIDEYRRKQDKLLQFLEEKAEENPAFEVPLLELHTAFANWCCASGLMSVSIPRFKELLEERQIFTKKKRPAGSGRAGRMRLYVLGVRLLPENG